MRLAEGERKGTQWRLPARLPGLELNLVLVGVAVDQLAGDAEWRGNARQGVRREPSRILDLVPVDLDLARCVLGGESEHQRVRERPRLAGEVLDPADLDPDFLANLPTDSVLKR